MFESSSNRLLLEFNCCDPWTEFTPPPDEADETFAEANAPKSPRMVDGIISESFVPRILGSMSIILGLIILIKVIKLQTLIWFIHNIFMAKSILLQVVLKNKVCLVLLGFTIQLLFDHYLTMPSWDTLTLINKTLYILHGYLIKKALFVR